MSKKASPILFGIIFVALALAVWKFWPSPGPEDDRTPLPATLPRIGSHVPAEHVSPTQPVGPATSQPVPRIDVPVAASQPTTLPADTETALADFRTGMDLLKQDQKLPAREKLSAALLSYRLPAAQEEQARLALTELADRTIFSGSCYDNDPYVYRYTFLAGEVINRVETKQKLHVPPPFILKINNISDAAKIQANQTLTFVQGPFHAIVHKKRFLMDVYLERENLPKVFARRFRVGLGKDDGTPVGLFRVALGRKLKQAPWNPPPNAPIQRTILWGEPGYPLGTAGYWISLEGIDDRSRTLQGYGIHGTNEPNSIGRSESLGCIRLSDPDIDAVFSMLYEKWSTVEIRP